MGGQRLSGHTLILAIKSNEPEIAVRLVRRNRALKCNLCDSNGKQYPSLKQFIPEHQLGREPEVFEEYPDLSNVFAMSRERGRIGTSAARLSVVLGMVSVVQAMDEANIDLLRGQDTNDSNGRMAIHDGKLKVRELQKIRITCSPPQSSPRSCENTVQVLRDPAHRPRI